MATPTSEPTRDPTLRRVLLTSAVLIFGAVITTVAVAAAVKANGEDLKAVVGVFGAVLLLGATSIQVAVTVAGKDAETRRVKERFRLAQSEAARCASAAAASLVEAQRAETEAESRNAEVLQLRNASSPSASPSAIVLAALPEASVRALESLHAATTARGQARHDAQMASDSQQAVEHAAKDVAAAVRAGTRRSFLWAALIAGTAMALMPDLIDSLGLISGAEE